ncbi:helix-turn-helix domain-containing protein [Streptomyces sp. NPDC002205]|uniref:helix-turn-helix domain-containing protein n=1 Tax=Streptomyces sp. NPDC002205 TaxID=3154411 RepID=UPI0033337E57
MDELPELLPRLSGGRGGCQWWPLQSVVVRHGWVRGWFIVQTEVLRAFRFTLDPTHVQEEVLLRHAGAARWAFNHAVGMKVAAHHRWRGEVQALVDTGLGEAEAWSHARKVLTDYQEHYNGHRPHRSRQQLPPSATEQPAIVHDLDDRSPLRARVVGGIINEYRYAT